MRKWKFEQDFCRGAKAKGHVQNAMREPVETNLRIASVIGPGK
jgi:hypothetical protein